MVTARSDLSASAVGRGRHRGQILIVFALMLPVLIGLVGLGIDSAALYWTRRDMQGVADLAALAGALDLPFDPLAAASAARANALANGFGGAITVTTPLAGDPSRIEVVITRSVDTYFMGVFGFETVTVTARAVAERHPPSDPAAVFTGGTHCGGSTALTWAASYVQVTGRVHANGTVWWSGNNSTVDGHVGYRCSWSMTGNGNWFAQGPTLTGQRHAPFSFTLADFPCTFSRAGTFDLTTESSVWVGDDPASGQLRPGVYCATGSSAYLRLVADDVSGNVTLVSTGRVTVIGERLSLTAFRHDVLAFADVDTSNALRVVATGGTMTGNLLAPHGTANVTGREYFTLSGSILGHTAYIAGWRWSIVATGPTIDEVLRLID
jgi:Flp pilus assembly protein TadG